MNAINAAHSQLGDLPETGCIPVEVAKEYASQELLKDLEERLVAAVRELKDEFHDMPERLAVLIAAAKTKQD
ncbi:MAG: hypothetical protein ABJL55_11905 [Roseibium sp.]